MNTNEQVLAALDEALLAIGRDHIATAADKIKEAISALESGGAEGGEYEAAIEHEIRQLIDHHIYLRQESFTASIGGRKKAVAAISEYIARRLAAPRQGVVSREETYEAIRYSELVSDDMASDICDVLEKANLLPSPTGQTGNAGVEWPELTVFDWEAFINSKGDDPRVAFAKDCADQKRSYSDRTARYVAAQALWFGYHLAIKRSHPHEPSGLEGVGRDDLLTMFRAGAQFQWNEQRIREQSGFRLDDLASEREQHAIDKALTALKGKPSGGEVEL